MSRDPESAQSGQPRGAASGPGEGGGDPQRPVEQNEHEEARPAQDGADAGSTAARGEDPAADTGSEAPYEAADAGEDSLAEQLEAVRAELAEQKDRYLRAAAEAENIRRRADNDIANARKYAIEGFASEVLAVRDSLEIARSLEIGDDDAGAVAKMKEGLDLTLKQLDGALSKFAIEAVDPEKGEKLDPERHQAMSTQETNNVPPNHILTVIQKGYMIHDRLLRPAMVVVAKKPQDETHTEGETA